MNKEQTPAAPNSAEAAKQEKDGLLVLGDLAAYAAAGFAAIPPAGLERLKWYGLYVQRPREEGRFMLRIKLPGGEVRADQAAAVAEVAARYGRGLVDITTRQDLELHWLEIGDVPAVLAALGAAGLTTRQAAGDCPRNIVASPLAGVDPEEVLDVRPLVASLNAFFDGNRQFSNLPRKFKISLSGHPAYTAQGEINDLSFAPAVKTLAGRKVKGFHVRVGGGLSAQPRLARSLDLFVRPEEVVRLAAGVAAIFRDHGYREKRNHCRLKFLLDDWGAARFEEELRRRTGLRETRGDDVAPGAVRPGWFGWHAQKQPGRAWLGLSVPAGRLTARELQELARLAAACGDGTLRATSDQNLVLLNLEDARREDVLKEAVLLRLTPFPASVTGPAVTCIGRELCPFAVVETDRKSVV